MTDTPDISLDDKWRVNSGRVMMNGTQALARVLIAQSWLDRRAGLDTAGYITGYRGSPLGNVDTTLWAIGERLKAANIRFQPGVNEDLAATAAAGTQQIDQMPGAKHDGVFAAWYGKGPGVDRSGDALKHGHYAGAHQKGGVVLFYGDDHAGKSSTVAYQSEQAIAANIIPSFYPANVRELIEYGLLAYALSRHSGLWIAVKCVNEVVEQTLSFDIDLENFSPSLPPISNLPPEGLHAGIRPFNPLRTEQIVIEHRLPLVMPFVRANQIDRPIFSAKRPRLAIVSAGKSYGDVLQALELLRIDEERAQEMGLSLYKVGCIWPLDSRALAQFAKGHDTVLVVEEKKSFIQAQMAEAFLDMCDPPRLIGKQDEYGHNLLSSVLPLEPAEVAQVILERLSRLGIVSDEALIRKATLTIKAPRPANEMVLKRSPFFCSGCPHSRSTKVPDGSLSMTGIGCHTMINFVAPEKAILGMQMGAEGANWIGLAPFTSTPHIFQNMGDGTYYHSGLLAIRAAVASGVNVTYKILYNDAVAMTGGQPVDGPLSVSEIAQQVRHEGVERIVVLSDNPDHHRRETGFPAKVTIAHRDELDRVQRELRNVSGCSVLIYEQTCAAEKRRRRKRGKFPDPPKRMIIAEEVCEGCGDCSVQSSCVSISPKETALGRKRVIDQSSCNKDFSCNDGFCPSFVTLRHAEPRQPERALINDSLFAELPVPAVTDTANIMIAGIGGTGVITVGALIGMAAHLEGKTASLFDMTGLAQKNGAVYSHIRIATDPSNIRTQRLGRGEADLLLAFDLVACLAEESADTLSAGHTQAIVNEKVVATAAFQFDRDAVPEPGSLLARLKEQVDDDSFKSIDASSLALGLLGDTIGANLMLVGIAAQRGLLPVSIHALERAIALNGVAAEFNSTALKLGRMLAEDPERVMKLMPAEADLRFPETVEELIQHRSSYLEKYQDKKLATRFAGWARRVEAAERSVTSNSNFVTPVFIRNYARLLAIKDEYEVARLLTDDDLNHYIVKAFGRGAQVSFNLAPPLLWGRTANGRPRKREIPRSLSAPIFWMLKAMKPLRGTLFDMFSYTAERKAERDLIAQYEALTERTLDALTKDNLAAACELLDRVSSVRGFGPVKEAALKEYHQNLSAAERSFAARPVQP